MTTIDEYIKLYQKKDPKLMDRVGMDMYQKESVESPCKWISAVLERLGSDMQDGRFIVTPDNQYRVAILIRDANTFCRKCRDC